MTLTGYIDVPDAATAGGAPIDAFQGRAFSQNARKMEVFLRSLVHTTWLRNDGIHGNQTYTGVGVGALSAKTIWRCDNMTVSADWSLDQGFPLIVFAREKITVNNRIIGNGMGAQDTVGHLGGSGGGAIAAGSAGHGVVLPIGGGVLAAGGATGSPGIGLTDFSVIFRALSILPMVRGGGAGGPNGATKGGKGGGVVVLVAPTIEFGAGGTIEVMGEAGTANGVGGGGGGIVVLITKVLTPNLYVNPPVAAIAPAANNKILTQGGAGHAPGGSQGGHGYTLEIPIP